MCRCAWVCGCMSVCVIPIYVCKYDITTVFSISSTSVRVNCVRACVCVCVCVSVCVCVCVCVSYFYITGASLLKCIVITNRFRLLCCYAWTPLPSTCIHIHTHTHTITHTQSYTHTHTQSYTHMRTHVHTHT